MTTVPKDPMESEAVRLYLDLMKKTLSFSLWPEPPVPVDSSRRRGHFTKRALVRVVSRLLATRQLTLAWRPEYSEQERTEGRVWPGYAETMIGMKRLDNIQECVEAVLREGVPGDLIETGAWRGGACIFMRAILAAHGVTDRRVFVADSFQGLPEPEVDRHPADAGDIHHTFEPLVVSQEEVEANFRKYGLLDDKVVFLKGWFKDSLPNAPIRSLAILRLDGDMYGSTMDSLENLYPKLSVGGFCLIDDYFLPGCRQAVDDFRARNGITAEMKVVDWTGRSWKKIR